MTIRASRNVYKISVKQFLAQARVEALYVAHSLKGCLV
jgi:hypothetical protein